ncbi:MAG: IclR family transcriptional regulator [Candidatus Sulfotelmatobacter sp.]
MLAKLWFSLMARPKRSEFMITSLDRGLRILDILANESDGLGVSELGRRLASDKSLVFRTLSLLIQHDYVEQDPTSKKYTLAWKVIQIAGKRLRKMNFYAAAVPILKEVAQETKEMAILAVMIGDIIAYLHIEEGAHVLNISSGIGQPIPIHSTASGKAIFAHLPIDERRRILSENGLPRFTQNTITSISEMEKHLSMVRAQGFAVDDEETYPGIRCIAMPVRNFNGAVVGAIAIGGASQRITLQRLKFYEAIGLKAAERISARLGYADSHVDHVPTGKAPIGKGLRRREPSSSPPVRRLDAVQYEI